MSAEFFGWIAFWGDVEHRWGPTRVAVLEVDWWGCHEMSFHLFWTLNPHYSSKIVRLGDVILDDIRIKRTPDPKDQYPTIVIIKMQMAIHKSRSGIPVVCSMMFLLRVQQEQLTLNSWNSCWISQQKDAQLGDVCWTTRPNGVAVGVGPQMPGWAWPAKWSLTQACLKFLGSQRISKWLPRYDRRAWNRP